MNDIGETKHTSCLIKGVFSPPAVADPGKGPGGGGRPPYFWTKLRPEGLSLDDRAPPLSQGLDLALRVIQAPLVREQSVITGSP